MWLSPESSNQSEPPIVLRLYLWFAIGVCAFQVLQLISGDSLSFTMPFTGWSIAGPYLFSLAFTYFALRVPQCGAIRAVRRFLQIGLLWGIIEFAIFYGRRDFGNPFLMVSAWRPIFTVLPPSFWLIVLNSRSVRAYCAPDTSVPGANELVD